MKYKELKNPCKELIKNSLCLGCNKLEDPNFISDINCSYSKEIAKESINKINKCLGINKKEI